MNRLTRWFSINTAGCQRSLSAAKSMAWLCSIALLCVCFLYRIQILNGFTILGGDRFDAVISATILEHWHRVFSGEAFWSDAGYFYPYKHTIAQSDAYFLVSLPYHLLRLLHFDPLLAQTLTNMVLRVSGFLFFYAFCRKSMALCRGPSIAGASLFVMMAASSAFLYRSQFSTLAFAPLVAMLTWQAVRSLNTGDIRGYCLNGSGAGALFSLWCFSCFYLAWFFLYFSVIFFISLGIYRHTLVVVLLKRVVRHWRTTLVIIVVTGLFLIPFIDAFVPKAIEVGTRRWESVEVYLIPFWDIFLMHPSSVGRSLATLALGPLVSIPKTSLEYAELGFSPLVLICFVVVLVKRQASTRDDESLLLCIMKVGVVTIGLCALSAVTFHGFSIWKYVYEFFPGASALNVVSSIFIFLVFPSALVFAFLLDRLSLTGWPLLIYTLSFLCLEVNIPYINLDRAHELSLLSIPLAPSNCKSFYVGALDEQIGLNEATQRLMGIYPHNVAAMFIAQEVGIPTINGEASFNPPDWNFGFPARSDYDGRVSKYINDHQLTDVCRLDIQRKSWAQRTL